MCVYALNCKVYCFHTYIHSVEVVFDDQCDVIWTLPEGVETIPLFQTTSFNIDGECLDLIGGVQGRTFHFQVRERERERDGCHKKSLYGNVLCRLSAVIL